MHFSPSKLPVIIAALLILWPLSAFSQARCPVMPSGFLCISQEAGNIAVQNARLVPALEAKVMAQEQGLSEKDKSIQELKDTNQKNVLDLSAQINKVTADWAFEKGKNTALEADKVLWTAVIEVLVKNSRQKTNGIKIF